MNGDEELLLAIKDAMKIKRDLDEDEDSSHPLMHVRWVTMDSYVANLLFILAIRASGKSLKNHVAVNRLIECRIMLEKIRSLFKKQDKHISRLISMGKSIERGEDFEGMDESNEFQPKLLDVDNIDSDFESDSGQDDNEMSFDSEAEEVLESGEEDETMEATFSNEDESDDDSDSKDEDESDSDDDEIETKVRSVQANDIIDDEIDSDEVDKQDAISSKIKRRKPSNIYHPPKINPVYFDDEGGMKKKKLMNAKQSKEIERRLLQEEKLAMLQESGETPIEIKDYSSVAMKQKKKDQNLQRYEEANMVRLSRDRKERQRTNQMDDVMDLMTGKQDYPEETTRRIQNKKKTKRLKGKFKKFRHKRR